MDDVVTADDEYDYWVDWPARQAEPETHCFDLQSVETIVPLDAQFGVAEPRSVPETLRTLLFGSPASAEGDDPALRTYVLLYAAKVQGLPEQLEASGLHHRCLFKGVAYEELRDVAPWIIELKEDHPFTRNLFTRSDAPSHLWDQDPGIYLRAHTALEDLCAHFRKFTRVRGDDGQWFYWRFWEGSVFSAFAHEPCLAPVSQELLCKTVSAHWRVDRGGGQSAFCTLTV